MSWPYSSNETSIKIRLTAFEIIQNVRRVPIVTVTYICNVTPAPLSLHYHTYSASMGDDHLFPQGAPFID